MTTPFFLFCNDEDDIKPFPIQEPPEYMQSCWCDRLEKDSDISICLYCIKKEIDEITITNINYNSKNNK